MKLAALYSSIVARAAAPTADAAKMPPEGREVPDLGVSASAESSGVASSEPGVATGALGVASRVVAVGAAAGVSFNKSGVTTKPLMPMMRLGLHTSLDSVSACLCQLLDHRGNSFGVAVA